MQGFMQNLLRFLTVSAPNLTTLNMTETPFALQDNAELAAFCDFLRRSPQLQDVVFTHRDREPLDENGWKMLTSALLDGAAQRSMMRLQVCSASSSKMLDPVGMASYEQLLQALPYLCSLRNVPDEAPLAQRVLAKSQSFPRKFSTDVLSTMAGFPAEILDLIAESVRPRALQ